MDTKNFFLIDMIDKIDEANMPLIKQSIEELNDEDIQSLMCISFKNPIIGLLFGFFMGIFGFDRFYKGDTILGIFKIILFVLCIGLFIVAIIILVGFRYEDLAIVLFIASGLTLLASLIWWFIDLFMVYFGIKKDNFTKTMKAIHILKV
ncbi:NINE protein [Campylobacter sp. MIT 97-5078]|uniref:NINE protein n=1 Tax=Campylobacter sp. MIT 97-5078 TaxID=1548153 RepID=UPI0006910946|nr:NINE protein [Campylobacter sp. MIT 97-5078]TQR27809.1 NINE protein [Campylobacter sp. MIT 97-5078]